MYIFSYAYDKPPRRVAVRVIPVDPEGKVVKAVLAIPITVTTAETPSKSSEEK